MFFFQIWKCALILHWADPKPLNWFWWNLAWLTIRDPIPHDSFGGRSTTLVVWANMWLDLLGPLALYLWNRWSQKLQIWHADWSSGVPTIDSFGGRSTTLVVWANMWLVTSMRFFSFFFFFCCFLQREPRSHFLTDRHDLYAKTRVSGQGCAFWGSPQYPTTFRELNPQTSPKWVGIGISQPNQRSSKIE